ncbi:MAG TPA: amidohydrolase family protein [Conexibacter sp.]|jgi:aminocarboxymuconate-semialdehyde decarboxylase
MVIDVHAHYFPDAYVIDVMNRPDIPHKGAAPLHDVGIAERLEDMERLGIGAQVLSLGLLQPYLEGAEESAHAARVANDLYADLCREHPGTLFSLGALPLPHVDASLAEIERCFGELGMRGVGVTCSVNGRELDDPVFEPVFEELNRRGAVLTVHPNGAVDTGPEDNYRLNWVAGALFEDTLCALRLALARIPERYPDLQLVVPHLGGTVPYLVNRVERLNPGTQAMLRKMWFDTIPAGPLAAQCFDAAVGADRLLLGSDFPFANQRGYEHRLSYISDVGFDAEQVRQIRGERAAALLGVGAEAGAAA